MKTIIAVLLVIVCAAAQDLNAVERMKLEITDVNPKYTAEEWDKILNQEPVEEEYDESLLGSVPQPDNAGKSKLVLSGRIINGTATKQGVFPWQVYIIMDNSYLCGGSVIANNWILTAGHCAATFSQFYVYLGKTLLNTNQVGQQVRFTTTKIVHPQYNRNYIRNDIALLNIQAVAYTSYISPVKLPRYSDASKTFAGTNAIISGFGKTTDASAASNSLMYTTVIVITNAVCAQTYGNYIASTNICTKGPGISGTCSGDSGGPLVYLDGTSLTEIGIVSFGAASTCTRFPSAYTRVTSYLKWISTNTGILIRN